MDWRNSSLLIIAIHLSPGISQGYPVPVDFDGKLLRWPVSPDSPPITYMVKADVDADLEEFGPIVDETAEMWSAVPGSSFRLERSDESAQITVHLQRQIEDNPYSAGYAVFDEYNEDGPVHCSVYVLTAENISLKAISKTILHEMGHCAGLGHSLVAKAIMSYELDKNSYELDIDDEAAMARLYPADGSRPSIPPGCAIGSWPERAAYPLVWGILAIPLLTAVVGTIRGKITA